MPIVAFMILRQDLERRLRRFTSCIDLRLHIATYFTHLSMRCESSHIGHRNFCLVVTTKAEKADGEMGIHHFYDLSHWNYSLSEYSSSVEYSALVIYANRRLYDFASGSGTQIASFHILPSI
ncbi:Pyridoxine 5'-phosphate synthase [Trichinella spiralis]|uniref:Pyridoxine 5'-phosphate synthase n=1 Tax=Trichinella spiralis TaxID=6334 RepID=A0ABR3L2C9_TRISP